MTCSLNSFMFWKASWNFDFNFFFRGRRQRRNIMQKKNRDMQFAFDHVFPEGSQQQYVYENTTKSIVDSLLNGYNCSGRQALTIARVLQQWIDYGSNFKIGNW